MQVDVSSLNCTLSTHSGTTDLINIVSRVSARFVQLQLAALLVNGDLACLANQRILPNDLTTAIAGLGTTLPDHFELMTKNVSSK